MKKFLITVMVVAFATVVLGQTKTEIKTANLPACVTDWVKKTLKDWSIDKAYKLEVKTDNKLAVTYNVRCVKGKETQWYSFTSDCGTVKKITLNEAEKPVPPKPQPLPPQKTKPEEPKENENPAKK
jgi:hypothetical protein